MGENNNEKYLQCLPRIRFDQLNKSLLYSLHRVQKKAGTLYVIKLLNLNRIGQNYGARVLDVLWTIL